MLLKILNIALVMFLFCSCGSNQQKEEQQTAYMHNELWTWSNSPNMMMGYSESLYLLENGYFQYITSYSGGAYWVHWYTGKYAYGADSSELIFTPENGNLKEHDGTINLRDCLDTVRILSINDTTVVIDREPIGWDKCDTTTFKRRQNTELLVIPEGTHVNVDTIFIQKYGETTPILMNKDDKRAILDIINTATLNKEWNDGRMLKLPANDYTMIVKYQWEIKFDVWKSGNMKQEIAGRWYNVDYPKLEGIINKYVKPE